MSGFRLAFQAAVLIRRWGMLAIAAGCLLTRGPGRLFAPELWAEDGPVWLQEAYRYGASCLLRPHTGYLQTLPRLVALVAVLFPLRWAPAIFAAVGFILQLVPVALLLSRRGKMLLPSSVARLLLVGFYIGVPNSFETYVFLTDAQWHVAIISFLFVVLPAPRRAAGRLIQVGALAIGGVSGPFSLLLAPIAWWHAWRQTEDRNFALLQAGFLSLAAAVQIDCIIHLGRTLTPLGANFSALARVVTMQIFLGGMLGIRNVTGLFAAPAWRDSILPAASVTSVGVIFIGFAVCSGPPLYRKFVAYAVLVTAAALASPVASAGLPQWLALEIPGAGSRYSLLPILAFFAAVLVLAARPDAWRRPARVLLLLFLSGVVADWRYSPTIATDYGVIAHQFDAAPPGVKLRFPEDPDPKDWNFTLIKH